MSTNELTRRLVALPLSERVELAQILWQSVHEDAAIESARADDASSAEEARTRDAQLTSGEVTGRSHDQVMEAARQLLRCG